MPLPIPRNLFPSLNTFLGNGSLLATPSRSDLNSGHGRWARTGHRTFEARVQFFRFATDGTYLGTQELTRTIQLVTHDTFTETTTVEIFDVDGNSVGNGCATSTAERFE